MKNAVRFPHLHAAHILRDLPDEVKSEFLNDCDIRTYQKGDTIIVQGKPVAGMYLIAHGSVEVTSVNAQGQSVLIHLHRQSDVIGETESLADRSAAANCIAATQSVLLFCPRDDLINFMRNRIFMRNMFRDVHERLVRDNSTKFVDQFYSVEQRLCDYLFRLSVDKPEISKTQGDLAGLLGCARQTLNRELGRLRDKNILEIEKGRIRVLDREALHLQSQAPTHE